MNKLSVLTKMLCVLLCLYSTQSSLAQTKFWGVGAATGQADAQFSNPFVQSTIAGNYSPTQWTALSIYDSDTITPGNAYWVRNLTGVSQGGYATGMMSMPSPSTSNGVALFDSDFMDNGGTQGAFGMGSSPGIHKGELISPRIDLTGAMDSAVMVRFYSYYRRYQIDEFSLSISADDGLTWANTESITAVQPVALNANNTGWVRILFPSFTMGVSDLTQCRIKFTFEGYYYYAMIDDISIEMTPEYDIALSPTNSNGGDVVRIGGNTHNTLININPNECFFGATIFNRGSKDILPNAHPRLRLKINYYHPVSGQITYNVYTDTINITDTIKAKDPNGVTVVEYLRDINFITGQWVGHGAGDYDITYWVEQDSVDGYGDNDTIRFFFTINERHFWWNPIIPNEGYVSKARLYVGDGKVYGSTAIFPSNAPITALENGSVFYFSGMNRIDSIVFRYIVPYTFSGANTQTLLVKVSRFEDGTNGGIADGLISTAELIPVMQAQAVLSGLVPNTTPFKVVSNFVDPIGGAQISAYLSGSGFYYVSVLNQPALFGGPATFEAKDVPLLRSDQLNYSMNAAMTSSSCPIVPAAFRVIDSSGVESWNTGIADIHQVPSIGIYLYEQPLVGINAIASTESSTLTLYPNPTTNHLNIQTTFQEPTDVQYIITDITGRVYYIHNNKNSSTNIHTVDITALPAGVYLVSAKTEKGVSTEKFVKE